MFGKMPALFANGHPFIGFAFLTYYIATPMKFAVTLLNFFHLYFKISSTATQCLTAVFVGASRVTLPARGSKYRQVKVTLTIGR